jgi:hypothetical protein
MCFWFMSDFVDERERIYARGEKEGEANVVFAWAIKLISIKVQIYTQIKHMHNSFPKNIHSPLSSVTN